jgi:hypothetical protein
MLPLQHWKGSLTNALNALNARYKYFTRLDLTERSSEDVAMLLFENVKKLRRLFARMKIARAASGKSYIGQLIEIFRLRKKYTRLSGSDYFDYQLYDDQKFSFAQKAEFAGNGICGNFYGSITERSFVGMAGDKLSAYGVFKGFGLPQAKHYAIISQKYRFCGDLPHLTKCSQVLRFFREQADYPIFVKPIRGKFGEGAHVIKSYNHARSIIEIDNGANVDASEFIGELLNPRFEGFVCQERLKPHPEIENIAGGTIASFRFVVLYYADGPRIIRAVWKIPAQGNITDNFDGGRGANLVAALNLDTGLVERVVGGRPNEETELIVHPDTGKQMTNFTVPFWEEACEVCRKAAGIFPTVRYQGWDIAITNHGPKILELNVGSHVDLVQRAYGKGIFDAEFQAFVKEYSKPEYKRLMYKQSNNVDACKLSDSRTPHASQVIAHEDQISTAGRDWP